MANRTPYDHLYSVQPPRREEEAPADGALPGPENHQRSLINQFGLLPQTQASIGQQSTSNVAFGFAHQGWGTIQGNPPHLAAGNLNFEVSGPLSGAPGVQPSFLPTLQPALFPYVVPDPWDLGVVNTSGNAAAASGFCDMAMGDTNAPVRHNPSSSPWVGSHFGSHFLSNSGALGFNYSTLDTSQNGPWGLCDGVSTPSQSFHAGAAVQAVTRNTILPSLELIDQPAASSGVRTRARDDVEVSMTDILSETEDEDVDEAESTEATPTVVCFGMVSEWQ